MSQKKSNKEITQENMQKVDDLLKRIKTMSDEEYSEFVHKCSLFRNYSFWNQIILYSSGATNVKGFRQWQEIGRTVKKGEKAIWILAPCFPKKTKDDDDDEDRKRPVYFRSVPVFDISQTEGDELPAFGGHADVQLDDIRKTAVKLGFSVDFKNLKYKIGGYINKDGQITINSVQRESDNVATLVHEIAHGLLQHVANKKMPTEQKEQEAETLCYLIGQEIGYNAKSEMYLKSWKMSDSIKDSMTRINKAYKTFMNTYQSVVS